MFRSEKVDQEGQVFGEVHDDPGHAHDAVFGKITNDGPNYRNVSRYLKLKILTANYIYRLGGLAQLV